MVQKKENNNNNNNTATKTTWFQKILRCCTRSKGLDWEECSFLQSIQEQRETYYRQAPSQSIFLWRVMSISTSHSKMVEERGEGKEVHGNHWIKKHKDHIASSSWLKIKERQDWRLSSGITPLTIIRTSTQEVIFENDIIVSYRKARAEKNVRDLFWNKKEEDPNRRQNMSDYHAYVLGNLSKTF